MIFLKCLIGLLAITVLFQIFMLTSTIQEANSAQKINSTAVHTSSAQKNATSAASQLINVNGTLDRGNSLFLLGKYKEAITYYDKALATEPYFLPALESKADTLNKLGN